MPLVGQAKTDYQRDYMRKRRSNKPTLDLAVRPKLAALRAIMDDIKSKPSAPQTFIPRYQLGISKAGDKVRMRDGSIVTVPELDGDGNTLWQ